MNAAACKQQQVAWCDKDWQVVDTPTLCLNDNLVSPDYRGMRRYFREIIRGAAAMLGSDLVVYAPSPIETGNAKYISAMEVRGRQPLRLNQVIVSALALVLRPKVLFNAYYTDVSTPGHEVYTVYDMIPELMPQHFPVEHRGHRKFIAQKRRSIERASLVFSISQSTANDLLAFYPDLIGKRVVVTPLGVDTSFFEPASQFLEGQERPYFLYVGHRGAHKNFAQLLHALAGSGLTTEHELVVLSPTPLSPEEAAIIRDLGLAPHVRLFLSPSDATLKAYYRHAVALVYPSQYEGFGLPILEAMACGTLVATSRTSSMPEVGGDEAFYFDPMSADSMAETLRHVADLGEAARRERIAQGIAHARTFTWERCAQQTMRAILDLL